MQTIYAIHAPNPEKLKSVMRDMASLGAPRIRVVDCGDHYMALEGSHRIAAAMALELLPKWDVIEQGDMIEISQFDWHDAANWAGDCYPAGEVAGELFSMQAVAYRFN